MAAPNGGLGPRSTYPDPQNTFIGGFKTVIRFNCP